MFESSYLLKVIYSFVGYFQTSKSHSWWDTHLLPPSKATFTYNDFMIKFCLLKSPKHNLQMQFGTHGNLEQHGFARNRLWTIDDNPPPLPVNPAIKSFVDLILRPSDEDLKIWPHRFVL